VHKIEALKSLGYNQTEIAEQTGYTRQHVSGVKLKYGGRRTPREIVLERHFPWHVQTAHTQCAPYRRLRDLGGYVATGGAGMTDDQIKRLRSFLRKIDGKVVEYDPEIPPEPGLANCGGWALREHTEADRGIIRVNEHTRELTDEGWRVWTRLPMLP
jgi:hypothetical protein